MTEGRRGVLAGLFRRHTMGPNEHTNVAKSLADSSSSVSSSPFGEVLDLPSDKLSPVIESTISWIREHGMPPPYFYSFRFPNLDAQSSDIWRNGSGGNIPALPEPGSVG